MKTSPCQRSLKLFREKGWTCAITERWNQFAKVRQDLFGFCDVLAISPSGGIVAIQTTSGDHVSHRLEKIRQEPKAAIWLASGGRIVVHGWRKVGGKGKRKVWECREVEVGKVEELQADSIEHFAIIPYGRNDYPHHD